MIQWVDKRMRRRGRRTRRRNEIGKGCALGRIWRQLKELVGDGCYQNAAKAFFK